MKYFTPDIWAGWQSDDDAVMRRAMLKWRRNLVAYRRHIRLLAPRLGRTGRFFTGRSMHDTSVLSFNIRDYPLRNLRCRSTAWRTSVEISLLTGGKIGLIYHLRYDGIREIRLNTKNDLFSLPQSRFGHWGYDELLAEGNAYRHNILFATGTEVSIAFERFSYRRQKASNQQIQAIAAKRGSA